MAFAKEASGEWIALSSAAPIENEGVVVSYESFLLWSQEEQEAFGAYEIGEGEPVPEGKRIVSTGIGSLDGKPVWVNVLEDIPPPEAPMEVTAAQAQVALYNAGLLELVEENIANHPYPPIRIWFRSATKWRKDNPYVLGMAAELELTDKQFNDLFMFASQVVT